MQEIEKYLNVFILLGFDIAEEVSEFLFTQLLTVVLVFLIGLYSWLSIVNEIQIKLDIPLLCKELQCTKGTLNGLAEIKIAFVNVTLSKLNIDMVFQSTELIHKHIALE